VNLPLFPDWWGANAQVFLEQLAEPSFNGLLLFRYAIQALACTLPIALADYLLGLALLRVAKVTLPRPLHHAAALGLGAGLAGTGIFLFGAFGRITTKGLFLFTAIQLIAGLAFGARAVRFPRPRWTWLLALPLLLVSLPDLMMPVLDYDSTMYHMASAKHYKETGRMTYHEGIRFNAQPHLTVMLYLRQWWLTGDANLTKLVNLEYFAMLLLLFQWLARRFRVKAGAWLAFALLLGTPIFSYSARVEYADLGLATWLALGFGVLTVARSSRRLLLAGSLLGFCAASKLQGHVVVVSLGAAWFLIEARRRRRLPNLALALPILLLGLPWWLRSFAATGTPVYPFLSKSPDVQNLFAVNATYGVGRDWLAFLLLPWNMIVVPQERFADLFRFGPSCLLLLSIGLAAVVLSRKPIDHGTRIAALGSLIFTVLWFRSGQVMRYEACLLGVWAYLLLASLRRLRIPGSFALVVFLPLLLWSCLMTSSLVRFGIPPPVTWPATQGALRNVLPYYRASLVANRTIAPGERLYLWFCDDARFYFPHNAYGDWFGGYTYTWLGDVRTPKPIQNLPALLDRLRANGFRYVVADRERARQMGTIYGGWFLSTGIVEPFTPIPGVEVLYDDTRYVVFRLPLLNLGNPPN
jgi:hypothetical protein